MEQLIYLLIALILVFIICLIIGVRKEQHENAPTDTQVSTIDQLIALHGEPTRIIVMNPLRSSEPDGVLLQYADTSEFCFEYTRFSQNDIIDITFNNSAVAFTPDQYQMLITLKGEKPSTLHIPLGNEVHTARETVENFVALLRE